MSTVLIVLALIAVVAYEVRADRKVKRSTAGATPVVIVRGLKPRWWRKLAAKALSGALTVAILAGLLLAALRMPKSDHPGIDYRRQQPPASAPSGTRTPSAPAHSPARTSPSPTSHSSTPRQERTS